MGNQWCAGRPPKVKAHEQEYKPGNDNAQDAENPKKYVEKNGVKLKDELKTVDQKVRKEIDNMDGKKVDTLDCPGVKKIVNEMDEKKPDSTVDVVDGPKIRKYAADKIYGKEIECPNGSKKVGKVDAKKVDETGRVVFIVKTVIEVPRSVVKKELQEVGKETILLPANKELVSVLQPPQVLQNQNKVADLHSDGLLGLGGAGATKAAAPSAGNGISAMMESFAKSSLAARQTQRNQLTQAQVTSSTTQMVSSSTTSTSTESSTSSTSSHRLHHLAASERKASSMKSDLSDFKNSISEMKIISNEAALNFTPELPSRAFTSLRKSMEDLADAADPEGDMPEPLVTFPDGDTPPPRDARCPLSALDTTTGQQLLSSHNSKVHVSSSASKTKFSAQEASANSVQRLQLNTFKQDNRSMKVGELSQQEATMKVQTDSYSSKQQATAQQARQTVSSSGLFSSQEKHVAQSSTTTITSKGMCTKSSVISEASQISQLMNGSAMEDELSNFTFDDLDMLCAESSPNEVEMAITRYSSRLDAFVQRLGKASGADMAVSATRDIGKLNEIIRRAWAVPTYGHKLGYSLCNTLRNCGGLDLLMNNCMNNENRNIQFSWAQLLEQCLITENRDYVVEKGLDRAVKVACACTKKANSVDHSRVGTGILEHLFKHSEGTCSDVIKLGGLDAVLFECRKNDVETLRHCAGALANLSLYGGADNQEAMIMRKVPMWLFPLAFHNDDNIKYYACLAIAVLVANTEIEADVLQSGTLNLVEPFVTSHNPSEFARSNEAHAHGQSKNWLQRLVPVLSSKREEARNLAAFHFCMEAGIKKQQGKTEIFREIGAIEPLKKVASCPNAVASKYAVQALRLIGEEIPHKLSQKVPQWSTEDVQEWVKQIGFGSYANIFGESQVDGDLLLQLNEDNLRNDIGLTNGIRRQRFHRELQNLKRMADYSSCDPGNLNVFLQNIGVEFSSYAYSMLNAGVDKETLQELTEEQLENECGIKNSIHRQHILNSIRVSLNNMKELRQDSHNKLLDVFVSYRRSNGSQLASLLKVHLQLRGFTVFIDVERLEAGKFDNNLLESIRQAKHFLLVLTPNSLDRCVKDTECKDWVHREIVAALQSQCNIIPITDNFNWPEAEELPEDMRQVCHFNGVHWVHDYQDACVDKLESFINGRGWMPKRVPQHPGFMRGEALGRPALGGKGAGNPPATPAPAPRAPPVYQRMASSDSGKGSDKDQSNGGTRD